MKSRSITIGIFLSAALFMVAGGLYWLASRAQAGNHQQAITLIRQIQQIESQWSIETARVRSDPFADFDALVTFIPRIERLKTDLSEAMLTTPNLPDKLASDLGAYLSAIDAKEERIERFKTGYAVLRNSIRYLPLAASSVMQQVEENGGEAAFVHNISTVTDEIHTYLATPAAPEKERLTRVLQELGDGVIARHPALTNTMANFVAHGRVLLDKQGPTEEIFQEATSDRIGVLGEVLITGLETEIARVEDLVSTYERGILASGGALWLLWLAIALRLPREKNQQENSRPTDRQPSPGHDGTALGKIAAAAAAPPSPAPVPSPQPASPPRPEEDGNLSHLTALLLDAEQRGDGDTGPAYLLEPTAHRVGLEILAKQLTALAERIAISTDMLHTAPNGEPTVLPDTQADGQDGRLEDDALPAFLTDAPDTTATDDAPPGLDTTATVVADIRAQANTIVGLAERLPSFSMTLHDHTAINIDDAINEAIDQTRAEASALVVKDVQPVADLVASEMEIRLLLSHLLENAVWAVQERDHNKGVIRIEARQKDDQLHIAITDNGTGIRSAERKKVFAPFYTSRENAAGMGLATVQHLVEKYGGSIHMNSLPNQGTMLRVALPTGTETEGAQA